MLAVQIENENARRAIAAIYLAVCLVMLLSFVALAVDGGFIYFATGQMQRTTDASALAGASGLMDGDSLTRQRAIESAGLNAVAGQAVTADELEIVIGNWSGIDRAFSAIPDGDSDGVRPNAVHVAGDRPNIGLFFAPVMGTSVTHVRRDAIAVCGSGVCAGVWGLEGITAAGDVLTDSYDSTAGPYDPGDVRPNGDICSCRDIVISGSGQILGDAMYGEGYDFVPHGSTYEVRGVVDVHACSAPEIEIDFATAAIDNDNDTIGTTHEGRDPFRGSPWDLRLSGNDYLTLAGGTYYFTSARLASQSYIELTGATTIYVDGPAMFTGGGVINRTRDPKDLIIFAAGPDVTLAGTADFYGAVIAPDATVDLEGTGDYYGTILGRFLDIHGDAVIHVDEALVFELFGIDAIAPVLVR